MSNRKPDPTIRDLTGHRIAESIQALTMTLIDEGRLTPPELRITSLDSTELASSAVQVVEVVGIPTYVEDVTAEDYAAYQLTDPGWYVFARVAAITGTEVTENTEITGAAGYIAEVGADHVDLAIGFEVAALDKKIVISWGGYTDTFVFKCTDLAIRNLDYRSTFYIYDLADKVTWEYALTTDTEFAADKAYYTLADGVYTLATVTAGDPVPAETYYNHSKVIVANLVRNVTYKLDAVIDCPMEIQVPEVADDGYGCWFELHLRHSGAHSITMVPPEGSDVKVAAAGASAAVTAGFNVVDMHYSEIDGVKLWMLANVHTNIPS